MEAIPLKRWTKESDWKKILLCHQLARIPSTAKGKKEAMARTINVEKVALVEKNYINRSALSSTKKKP